MKKLHYLALIKQKIAKASLLGLSHNILLNYF